MAFVAVRRFEWWESSIVAEESSNWWEKVVDFALDSIVVDQGIGGAERDSNRTEVGDGEGDSRESLDAQLETEGSWDET